MGILKLKKREKSLFHKAKYKKYSDIVSFKSPLEARISAEKLKEEYEKARSKSKKERIKKVLVESSNRAEAMSKNKRLSAKERKQLRRISRIYRRAYEDIKRSE